MAAPQVPAVAPPHKPLGAVALLGAGTWEQLSPAQRDILTPLAADWNKLDSAQRSKWLELAARFPKLSPEAQARVRERMAQWAKLSPTERQELRAAFQDAQQLRRADLQAKWEAYQALPEEKRQALMDKASQKKPGPAAPATQPSLAKSNIVPVAPKQPITAVAPSVRQAKPGATTLLITQVNQRPLHQQAGQPKVFADPSLVDPKTLLPRAASAASR